MNKIIFIMFTSLSSFYLSSVYSIGDTVSIEHQNIPLTICHGENEGSAVHLSDYSGKIVLLGIDATW